MPRPSTPRVRALWLFAVIAAVVLVLLPAAGRGAGTPPHGALTPLAGPGGCLGRGCAALRGFGPAPKHADAGNDIQLVAAPGGTQIYAVGGASGAIAVLTRDPGTGRLTQLPGAAGCITQRPVAACRTDRTLRPITAGALSADGTRLLVTIQLPRASRVLAFARDPSTGALTPLGRVSGCAARPDGCPPVRGFNGPVTVHPLGAGRELVSGFRGNASGAFSILDAGTDGRLHQPAGASGCFDRTGAGGCTKVPCMTWAPTGVVASADGSVVYVAGGSTDDELTSEGYVVALAPSGDGGLTVRGCTLTGHDHDAGFAPGWIGIAPDSDTVLMLLLRGNRGDGRVWCRMYAARPGPAGVLAPPVRVSPDLPTGSIDDVVLSPDAETLYLPDVFGTGGLTVARVSAAAVRPLPKPWGAPYHGRRDDAYGASSLLLSPDGRFAYLAVGAQDATRTRRAPQIRVFTASP